MQKNIFLLFLLLPLLGAAQDQDTSNHAIKTKPARPRYSEQLDEEKVFYSQKLINANTVEVLPKGVLEFRITHDFGDIGGSNGGVKRFFGLDYATDVRLGLQLGLTKKLNILLSRTRGGGALQQLVELGGKYQFLNQFDKEKSYPLSLTLFANAVVSTMQASILPNQENSFQTFGDRMSETVQLLAARRFGRISFQLNPTYVRRTWVVPGDDNNLFAIGGAVRVPLTKKLVIIADYFHPFHSQTSKDSISTLGLKYHDAFGVGFEILTAGHVFHLNFTNATEILENRFIPATTTSWGNGEFRWGFTISRNFTVFRDKKSK